MTGLTTPISAVARPYPSAPYAWYMVVLLTILYILSFIDRFILALLIEPIKTDLGLNDTQISLLLGPAFAIFYALMGLPIGWLADRGRRKLIVAAGVAVWSLATGLSGFAGSFVVLFFARMLVGTGEAALAPCAMSMIGDSFPKSRRGRPIAFYTAALSLGAGIAALAGAAVITWAAGATVTGLPFVGELAAWRITLLAVGLPGVILIPLVLLLREPLRRTEAGSEGASVSNFSEIFVHIGHNRRAFFAFISVFAYMILLGYTFNWGAAVFERTWGWSAVEYGTVVGILFLVIGPLFVYSSGYFSDRLVRWGFADGPMLVAMAGLPVMTMGSVIWPLMPTGEVAMAFLSLVIAGTAITTSVAITALFNIVPPRVRGQAVALYYIVTTLFGLGFGPLLVGLMSDYVFGQERLNYALAVLPIPFAIALLVFARPILRAYRSAMIEETNEPARG